MPYGNSVGVCHAGNKVFSASTKSLFSVDKTTGEIQPYDKATGLSDVDIKTINYDPATDVLAVAYNNANIDLIYHETEVYNLADFKLKNTSGSVNINGLSFYNGSCYVSSDMGISVIDLAKREIKNTYVLGNGGQPAKVYATTIGGNFIYAATAEGVRYAPVNSPTLQDFNTWLLFTYTSGIPAKKATYITSLNNRVYAAVDGNGTDTLYEYNGTAWTNLFFTTNNTITGLSTVNGVCYFTAWDNSNTTGKQGKIDGSYQFTINPSQGHVRPIGWFEADGFSWEGDFWNGLFKNNLNGYVENIIPDGPFSYEVIDIDISGGTVHCSAGGIDDSWGFQFNQSGFYLYNGVKWINKNRYTDARLDSFFTVVASATSVQTNKTYFGSFLYGLAEYNNATGQVQIYDKYNSTLEGSQGDIQRTKISSLTADEDGNLWIGNSGASKTIKMIPANGGTWREFQVPFNIAVMKKIVFDDYGQLWSPVRRSGEGILVWSYNNSLDNTADDKSRILGTGAGNGGLPDAQVFSIAKDKDGNIWAGTNQGIGVFYCPGSVLTTNGCDADQIKVERDGYIGYLFGTESVRAIAVDAANRKWIGTTNGLWLISADGKQELLKFNVDNSPLPANQITDIAIDDETGEVFIGTTAGLVSYQGDALSGGNGCDEALVYPNPVKPEYEGPIAVKGLTENAYVKITDVSGTLVYQGRANGSQMIWDGKGYNGQRAHSGVYTVYSSTDLGKEKCVAKILLAN